MAGANEHGNDAESFTGTRKLIRPRLTAVERRRDPSHGADPLSHALNPEHASTITGSHAEAFYFQKQIQQQTEMTVVLEDGEILHGVPEWYDRCSIKLRSGRYRMLVYKAVIKYLYKASEAHLVGTVMK